MAMQKDKKTVLFAILLSVVLLPVCFAKPIQMTTQEKRSKALELLDRYAETQDKLKSYIIKSEVTVEAQSSLAIAGSGKKTKKTFLFENRFDGNRYCSRRYMYGNVSSPHETVPKSDPKYLSFLWDGESHIKYSKSGNDSPGIVFMRKFDSDTHLAKIDRSIGTFMGGYFAGDHERIDSILRRADNISVQDKMEKIGGSDCYVIDAITKYGRYTLWIDRNHGYNLAKAKVLRKKGDTFAGKPLEGGRIVCSMKNVRFEKIDGIWVPMEADTMWDRIFSDTRNDYSKAKRHRKRTEVILNPDHEALGSFLPDDIQNGATVYLYSAPGITYTWQDGKVVDKDGREVDVDKLIKAESEKVKKPKPKGK